VEYGGALCFEWQVGDVVDVRAPCTEPLRICLNSLPVNVFSQPYGFRVRTTFQEQLFLEQPICQGRRRSQRINPTIRGCLLLLEHRMKGIGALRDKLLKVLEAFLWPQHARLLVVRPTRPRKSGAAILWRRCGITRSSVSGVGGLQQGAAAPARRGSSCIAKHVDRLVGQRPLLVRLRALVWVRALVVAEQCGKD
jgi:hypothetical protein